MYSETQESAAARFSCWLQQHGELPQDFADRVLQVADRAGRTEEDALVYQSLCQLLPNLREEAAHTQPSSIDRIGNSAVIGWACWLQMPVTTTNIICVTQLHLLA
jgi:hypothetical protein